MATFFQFLKEVLRRLRAEEDGQVVVEYLMLLAMTFITAYLLATGPIARFTKLMLADIKSAIGNVVQNGELTPGTIFQPGEPGHPADGQHFKALHLQ